MNTFTISKKHHILKMSKNNPPALTVSDNSIVEFETMDCFSNQLNSNEDVRSEIKFDGINPATGPLYIEGADIGDILKVEIIKIEIADQGVMCTIPHEGVLGEYVKETTRIIPIINGLAKLTDKISTLINPMIGVIGTAPKEEEIPTGSPGCHGGNMDCKKIREGSVVYLPVNTPGALLAMGDLHALMGDGEVVVCGVEIKGKVLVKVNVLKDINYPLPMVVDDKSIMTIASDLTLDSAHKKAVINMHNFLYNELKLTHEDSGILLSTLGDLAICQVVDPLMTCRMEMPKWILKNYGYEIR